MKFRFAFTLVELTVVMSVVLILSTIAVYGISQSRENDAFKSDYINFYDLMTNLKLRANIGVLAPTTSSMPSITSKQTLSFSLPASSYVINGVSTVNFTNGTRIVSVVSGELNTSKTYLSGDFVISFVPDAVKYQGPVPSGNSFISRNGIGLLSPITLFLQSKNGSITKKIIINGYSIEGNNYYISNINKE